MAKMNLDSGFLILYDWMPMLDMLKPADFRAVILALVVRQRYGTPIPKFKNQLCQVCAAVIEPTIERRLLGQKGGQKGAAAPH
ncbi:MAG: hypothetical protein IKC59_01195 [Clostridia bacterium]|nr:hypothetical protein [Clostridia bacterium]